MIGDPAVPRHEVGAAWFVEQRHGRDGQVEKPIEGVQLALDAAAGWRRR